ncbi:MAG: glycosyltransferase family 4 protein, partial [Actinobacteria bacterium]
FMIGLFGLQVARRHRIPYVHTYHTLYPEYVHYVWDTRLTKRLAEQLSRVFGEHCDSIIAPSSKIERYLRDWGVTVPVEVLATGIEVDRFASPDPARIARLRERLEIAEGDKVLLFAGRLGREKNVEMLVRALWHSRRTDTVLVIAGDGPDRGELEAVVEETGVSDQVRFAGYLEGPDMVAGYHMADAFVFASTTETQGLVVGEAMAAGLPVICVDDEAVSDFVVDGETGVIVSNRPEEMARAIDRVLGDDWLRLKLSEAGVARAHEFSIDNQTSKLVAHYERALEAYPKRRRALIPTSLLPGPLARIAAALEDDTVTTGNRRGNGRTDS